MAQDDVLSSAGGDTGAARHRMDAKRRAQRPSQRASRPSPERTAIDATDFPGCIMVIATVAHDDTRQRAWDVAAEVVDPEIPVLTIADLGVLREVTVNDGHIEVT